MIKMRFRSSTMKNNDHAIKLNTFILLLIASTLTADLFEQLNRNQTIPLGDNDDDDETIINGDNKRLCRRTDHYETDRGANCEPFNILAASEIHTPASSANNNHHGLIVLMQQIPSGETNQGVQSSSPPTLQRLELNNEQAERTVGGKQSALCWRTANDNQEASDESQENRAAANYPWSCNLPNISYTRPHRPKAFHLARIRLGPDNTRTAQLARPQKLPKNRATLSNRRKWSWSIVGRAEAIRLVRLEAPHSIQAGQQLKIRCLYETRGDKLQSLALYRNGREFYRFQPFERRQPVLAFNSTGVYVDTTRSRNHTVYLTNTTQDTSGRYRCEATGITFQEAKLETYIEVTPASSTGGDSIYRVAGQMLILGALSYVIQDRLTRSIHRIKL